MKYVDLFLLLFIVSSCGVLDRKNVLDKNLKLELSDNVCIKLNYQTFGENVGVAGHRSKVASDFFENVINEIDVRGKIYLNSKNKKINCRSYQLNILENVEVENVVSSAISFGIIPGIYQFESKFILYDKDTNEVTSSVSRSEVKYRPNIGLYTVSNIDDDIESFETRRGMFKQSIFNILLSLK